MDSYRKMLRRGELDSCTPFYRASDFSSFSRLPLDRRQESFRLETFYGISRSFRSLSICFLESPFTHRSEALVTEKINLQCFNELKERWYTASDHPIALLRAESRILKPWVV